MSTLLYKDRKDLSGSDAITGSESMENRGCVTSYLKGTSKGDFSREWQARIRMRDERNNSNMLNDTREDRRFPKRWDAEKLKTESSFSRDCA